MKEKSKRTQRLTPARILTTLKKHKYEMRKYGLKRIGLFGSYLNGTPTSRSDLDFLVVFDKPSFDDYIELKFMLEKIFDKKVDLVIEENLKPALQYVKKEVLYA